MHAPLALRPRRAVLVLAAAGLAAPALGAAAAPLVLDKGIIRRVTPHVLVLSTLDGARLRLTLDAQTRVVLNGRGARVGALRPGLAASARHTRGGLVRVVHAVGAAAAPAPVAPITQRTGVIDSVGATGLVLREPDGTTVPVAVSAGTRILLRGQAATLADLQPGLSATVRRRGDRPALAIRAFGRVPTVDERGVIVAVSPAAIVVRRDDGVQVQVAIDGATRVVVRGAPASVADLRAGLPARVTHTATGPAIVIRVPGG